MPSRENLVSTFEYMHACSDSEVHISYFYVRGCQNSASCLPLWLAGGEFPQLLIDNFALQSTVQGDWTGCRTGNGEKLSSSRLRPSNQLLLSLRNPLRWLCTCICKLEFPISMGCRLEFPFNSDFISLYPLSFQSSPAVAAVLHRQLRRRGAGHQSERDRHGVLDRHPLRHAHARLLLHPHLQLEDDQGKNGLFISRVCLI